ncbi:MAG: threonine/serine exporter family protein [Clostridia bacterium]|nr:threonine/serine exporter family protein [Oscillospiraceae bacterium]MBO5568957.1 threonine/serine exporter family protein [Clostridia bacterium]
MTTAIQLAGAFFGSMGFALLFGLPRRYLFVASLGGLLAWAVYLLADNLLHMTFQANLLAAAFSVFYAEALARRLKTPATLFLTTAILPLVPGGSLYETMSHAVRGEMELVRSCGNATLSTALAIALGISIVLAILELRPKG